MIKNEETNMEVIKIVNNIQMAFEKYIWQFDDKKDLLSQLFKVTSDEEGKIYVDGIYLGININEDSDEFMFFIDPEMVILHVSEDKEIGVGLDWPAEREIPFIDIIIQKEIIFLLDSNKKQ